MSNILKPMFAYQGGKTKVASKIYETITDNHGDVQDQKELIEFLTFKLKNTVSLLGD